METNKYIEVADGNFITSKETGEVQIKMIDNNGKPFIAMLYNVLLEPDLCNQFFSIITLMNFGHIYLFHKGFCTVFFSGNKQNSVTLLHSAKIKHAFLVKTKEKSKSQNIITKNKASLELLIRDKDTDTQGCYYLDILKMIGKIFRIG